MKGTGHDEQPFDPTGSEGTALPDPDLSFGPAADDGPRAAGLSVSQAAYVSEHPSGWVPGDVIDDDEPLPPPLSAEAEHTTRDAEFGLFYEKDMPRLVAFVAYLGAPVDVATDLAQDAMLNAYQQWNSLDRPRAWVRTVAKRAWWKVADRDRKQAHLTEPDDLPARSGLLTDDQATDITSRHQIMSLLQRLPPRQREVMAWTYDGYQPTEIAGILGLNPATVRSALREARASLAAAYEPGDTP